MAKKYVYIYIYIFTPPDLQFRPCTSPESLNPEDLKAHPLVEPLEARNLPNFRATVSGCVVRLRAFRDFWGVESQLSRESVQGTFWW